MMKRSRAALALLVSPWLYMAGHAMIGHAAAQSLPGENFLAPLPDDFKPGGTIDDSGMTLSTFLPKKETTANWTQMITTQVYHGMPKYDPDKFAEILGTKWKKACKGGEAKKLSGGLDNGYPVAIWQFYCPLNGNTHKPESMWMKLIAGNDSLYNAHFSWRAKLTPAMTKHALAYLQNVWVCDTRSNGHPCQAEPAAATPAPAAPSTGAPAAGSATTAKPSAAGQPPMAQPTTIPSTAPAQVVPPAKAPTATPAPSAPTAGAPVPNSPASKLPAPNSPAPSTAKPAGQ